MTGAAEVKAKMADVLNRQAVDLVDDAELISLVTSSFILVEMIIELQEEFGVRFNQADMEGVHNVGQLVQLFTDRMPG